MGMSKGIATVEHNIIIPQAAELELTKFHRNFMSGYTTINQKKGLKELLYTHNFINISCNIPKSEVAQDSHGKMNR